MLLRYLFPTMLVSCSFIVLPCKAFGQTGAGSASSPVGVGPSERLKLPPPFATESVAKRSRLIPWPKGKMPIAPPGFEVSLFADALDNPRSILVLPNGDVLVMDSARRRSDSQAILLRDTDKDGKPDRRERFLNGLNAAFGMALVSNRLYIGNTDSVAVFPYRVGDDRISSQGQKILDLPAGGHYTRNIVAS
jgi:glucose/arabinose dehydrogenase